ncbi:MAG: MarR family transcriptional regulator [Spirochaetales bacterium]|nr:MarR family transcriptional regulator [Spirochaetales bacterium]
MEYDELKLSNQLCFPVYAASRLIIREYQPYLDKLGITYPQYLVLMILWEEKTMPVNDIARKLVLKTNTVTPLLKRMEAQGIISRQKSNTDTRKVIVGLTDKGRKLRTQAAGIPRQLGAKLTEGPLSINELQNLKRALTVLIDYLS